MFKIWAFLMLCLLVKVTHAEPKNVLDIHIHYEKQNDSWQVTYTLPIAADHIAFKRRSRFDRRNLYILDDTKFKWDKAGEVLLIRSLNGNVFNEVTLTFPSFYDVIQKDYTHNLIYSDGSVLLYTDHLALGPNIIKDKSISPNGLSFSTTRFHFSAPQQNIALKGQVHKNHATWQPEDGAEGTYVYFGNIAPIQTDHLWP